MTHYDVLLPCLECEGAGSKCFKHSLSGNPETAVTVNEIDCPECSGTGEITIKEIAELYENIQELLEDYLTALNVELVA